MKPEKQDEDGYECCICLKDKVTNPSCSYKLCGHVCCYSCTKITMHSVDFCPLCKQYQKEVVLT